MKLENSPRQGCSATETRAYRSSRFSLSKSWLPFQPRQNQRRIGGVVVLHVLRADLLAPSRPEDVAWDRTVIQYK
jgi:hypothetical protein